MTLIESKSVEENSLTACNQASEKVECGKSPATVLKSNLNNHVKKVHSNINFHEGVIIDKLNDIYLVREEEKGVGHPVKNVKKCTIGPNKHELYCESETSVHQGTIASTSNYTSFECIHLRSINYLTLKPLDVHLDPLALERLVNIKRITEKKKKNGIKSSTKSQETRA